jgi:hypothetical protein
MFLMHMGQKTATSSVRVAQKATISIIRVVLTLRTLVNRLPRPAAVSLVAKTMVMSVAMVVAATAIPPPRRKQGAVIILEQGVWCIVASLAAPSPSRLFGAVMAAAKTRCDHGVGMEEGVWHRGGRVVERSKGSAQW